MLSVDSIAFLLNMLPELARRGAFEVDEFAVISTIRSEMLAHVALHPEKFADLVHDGESEDSHSSDDELQDEESPSDEHVTEPCTQVTIRTENPGPSEINTEKKHQKRKSSSKKREQRKRDSDRSKRYSN